MTAGSCTRPNILKNSQAKKAGAEHRLIDESLAHWKVTSD